MLFLILQECILTGFDLLALVFYSIREPFYGILGGGKFDFQILIYISSDDFIGHPGRQFRILCLHADVDETAVSDRTNMYSVDELRHQAGVGDFRICAILCRISINTGFFCFAFTRI